MRLLILSCSSKKLISTGQIPALDRYDGPSFRVLRRFLRLNRSKDKHFEVRILSAEYGLIPGDLPIPLYDCRMTSERANSLRSSVLVELENCLNASISSERNIEIFVCLGKDYLPAIAGIERLIEDKTKIKYAIGSQGQRLSSLYNWLYREEQCTQVAVMAASTLTYLRGFPVSYTSEQIEQIVADCLMANNGRANTFYSWYVCINGKRLSTKWLVQQLTGLPTSRFSTGEACRVLRALGLPVYRVAYEEGPSTKCP